MVDNTNGTTEAIVRFDKVNKAFGKLHVLRDLELDVAPAERVAIIGPSGSGKTTLLRILMTLEKPDSGYIYVNGELLWHKKVGDKIVEANEKHLRRIRGKIGMVFQHFNLVHRSTVLTNVLAGRLGYTNPAWSLINRFTKQDIEKAMQQMARVGISDKAHQRADELSGGQQQRVGIARALMQDPEMILADEPVASLDPVLAHSIMQYLEQFNREDGVTVLCSLHFLDLVHRYADRVIALNEGELVFDGLPQDIDDKRFKEIYGKDAERVG